MHSRQSSQSADVATLPYQRRCVDEVDRADDNLDTVTSLPFSDSTSSLSFDEQRRHAAFIEKANIDLPQCRPSRLPTRERMSEGDIFAYPAGSVPHKTPNACFKSTSMPSSPILFINGKMPRPSVPSHQSARHVSYKVVIGDQTAIVRKHAGTARSKTGSSKGSMADLSLDDNRTDSEETCVLQRDPRAALSSGSHVQTTDRPTGATEYSRVYYSQGLRQKGKISRLCGMSFGARKQ